MPIDLLSILKWFATASGSAVGVLFCFAIYSGRLILRRELDREKADCAAQKVMADFWRAKAEDWQQKALTAWNVTDRAVNLSDRAIEATAKAISNDKADKEHRPRQGR